jgi:hypothetical protein
MKINILPESIVNLIGSYLSNVQHEKILVRCEYFVKRRIELLEEVIKILLEKDDYKKDEISKVAEVIFNKSYIYPKSTSETQRNTYFQPDGCEYIRYSKDDLISLCLGSLFSLENMLKNTLKNNILRYSNHIDYVDTVEMINLFYKISHEHRKNSLQNGYLLLSVCEYINKQK